MSISTQVQQTMLSTEIVKIINELREPEQAVLTHDNFMKKVVNVLGAEGAVKFNATYRDVQNKERPCYALPKREANLMVMSESYKVQAAVYDKMVELETAKPKMSEQLEMNMMFAEATARMFNLPESGKLAMMRKVEKEFNLIPMLPSYAVDAPIGVTSGSSLPTRAAKDLLTEHGKPFSSSKFNILAESKGFIEQLERPSTKHDGVTRKFWCVTDKGLQFGKNLTSERNTRETQPHWYINSFGSLLELLG